MDGLIIKHKWLDLILKGKKTIEVRGSDTKKQGEMIYLLESRTSKVVGTCIDTLNEVLKDTDIGDFNIPLEDGLITYKHYKRNVRTLGGTGYKTEYQNEFGYQRAIISFNKTYGKNDEGNPNLFANNGLFSKIALNWDEIQKTIEEDITERLQNRNEELEAYKKLSNTNKKNKAKDNYEIGF